MTIIARKTSLRSFVSVGSRYAALLSLLLVAAPARAQQPLSHFLRAAAERSFEARRARAAWGEAGSRADEARGRLLPSLSASAGYTRNQQAVVLDLPNGSGGDLTQATITAEDQLEARVQLDVPIVDVAAWSRFFGAERRSEAARARLAASGVSVGVSVVTAYYQLVAARALLEATERGVATAGENVGVVSSRADAGLASEVDRHRARADLARAEQTRAEADLEEALATRRLEVLTGIAPSRARAPLEGSLEPEPELAEWLVRAREAPAVRAADEDVRASELERDASWQALLPVISAFASERWTNAPGFGPDALWALGLSARWTLDFATPAGVSTSERVLDGARASAEQARAQAETEIYEAWHRARALLARARAARVAEEASEAAATAARARFSAGTGTQLELSQSERDLLEAQVSRVRADADLRVARASLRLHAGLPPLGAPP